MRVITSTAEAIQSLIVRRRSSYTGVCVLNPLVQINNCTALTMHRDFSIIMFACGGPNKDLADNFPYFLSSLNFSI